MLDEYVDVLLFAAVSTSLYFLGEGRLSLREPATHVLGEDRLLLMGRYLDFAIDG